MLDIKTAIAQGADILATAGITEPRLTAQVLLAHALGRDRTYLYIHPEEPLSTVAWIHFGRYLHERTQGKPLQHILKSVEFYGRSYTITPGVLIPRPETEHVVERALALAPAKTPNALRIADICTGSGILAITLALEIPGAAVEASDISPAALAVAQTNSAALGAKIGFAVCDLMDALPGPYGLIVANPPYIPTLEIDNLDREVRDYDPRLALDGGPDGLEFYRRLIPQAWKALAPGGWFVTEIGYDQGATVPALFSTGWCDINVTNDLAGHPRVVEARRR
ncbi:MAG: peptide chain release factor N(5)-glutamine methyltransferase [Candidatus Solibacter sp.]|nr:peptide chain release factor N(5)-glutamine methyltransferase [Candidatus Solibacter sp.]